MKTSYLHSFCLCLLLGLCIDLRLNLYAQEAPILEAHQYTGITVVGTVNATYKIEATTNLAQSNEWITLTNVVLPASPWVYIDYASSGIAERFYRAVRRRK